MAETWTAIGVIAALLGGLFYLSTLIDALASRMNSRFDAVDARFTTEAARVDARFDRVEARLDVLTTRIDAHLDEHPRRRAR